MENEYITEEKSAETVTVLQAENSSLRCEIAELKLQNRWLKEQLGLAKKRQYGASSEKTEDGLMGQMTFTHNEAEAYAYGTKAATAEQMKVKEYERRRSRDVREVIPEGTPVEVVEHRLTGDDLLCDICGAQMKEIGKEVRRTLQIEPPKFWVREDVYYTYSCPECLKETDEANIRKAPREPSVLPGSFASPEAIAYTMTQKFVMYAPLYRQEQEWNRQGLKVTRQVLSHWMLRASDMWLKPVYGELHRQLLKEQVLHGDETTLQVLREPGRPAQCKSYMWLYRTSGVCEHPIVLYEYQETRKAEHAEKFLEGFSGWLHADGYQGYHKLPPGIRVVGCWAHARRKFNEALSALPAEKRKTSPAAQGEIYINELFRIEEALAPLDPEERKEKRLELEKSVLDALLLWAKEMQPQTAPKSSLGKALYYLLEQWPYLIRYLEDGRLELSNNRAERSIKPFVMGRKNWLFANTPAGAQSSAVVYSLIETAKENGLDPYRYLLWVLNTAPVLFETDTGWAGKLVPACAPGECRC